MPLVHLRVVVLFFFKQKTAYEMRISDWSSDVCSSDLEQMRVGRRKLGEQQQLPGLFSQNFAQSFAVNGDAEALPVKFFMLGDAFRSSVEGHGAASHVQVRAITGCPSHQSVSHRSEEHPSELQSLMRISYAAFCLHT